MVPRVHVAFADVNSSYRELIEIFKEYKFTTSGIRRYDRQRHRYHQYERSAFLFEDKANFQVRNILREAYLTYEYKNISELLVEMQRCQVQYCHCTGRVWRDCGYHYLEDVLEEIVGEIRDEYDEAEEELIQKVNDQEYIVEGSMNLMTSMTISGTELESEDYDSLGGFIIEHLDRLPEVGDHITTEDQIRLCSRKTGQKPYRNLFMCICPKSRFRTLEENDN